MPGQLRQVQSARREEERSADGKRAMSEAERPDPYEPIGWDRLNVVDRLAEVVAAA